MSFILLTEQRGCGCRFPYYLNLKATNWDEANKEVSDLLDDDGFWCDGLQIGMPACAEIIEVAKREEVEVKC